MKKTLGIVMMTAIVSCMNISQTQASQVSCFDGISDRIGRVGSAVQAFYDNLPNSDDMLNQVDRFGRRIENTVNDVLDGDFVDEMDVRLNRWVRPRPTNPVSRIFQSGTDFVRDTSRGLSHQLNRRFR